MNKIIKDIIAFASELDQQGFTRLAGALDKIAEDVAGKAPSISVEVPRGKKSNAAMGRVDEGMLEVQRLFNNYVNLRETMAGINYTDPSSPDLKDGDGAFIKAVPENGKVGDRTTWTAINLEFGWQPGKDYKNYAQLAKLLKTEIAKATESQAQDVEKLTAAEGVALQSWDRLIDLEYDPADAAKYRVTSFDALLDMLQNLPQQRGPADALHRVADELVYLAKEIKSNPAKSQDLVEWLDAFITDAEATETEEEA